MRRSRRSSRPSASRPSSPTAEGKVQRFALDHLCALNFVMDEALEGGVDESLNLDSHGKSWSFLLLGLEIRS